MAFTDTISPVAGERKVSFLTRPGVLRTSPWTAYRECDKTVDICIQVAYFDAKTNDLI